MSISAHDLRPILLSFFFFNDTATTEIYTLSLHDALPISPTIVATALPFNSQPWKGLFIDLLAPAFLSNTQSRSGSNTVTSASTPTLKVPFGNRSSRAGPTVNLAITSAKPSRRL